MSIRILADDLTGALDTAAAFAGEIPVFIDAPPAVDNPLRHAPVCVVATPSRDVPSEALAALLAPTVDWLIGGSLAYKKVDSLLRGNTFAEIGWLSAHGRFDGVVFAPAFPAQGRQTHDDRQWIVALGEAPRTTATPLRETLAHHGLTPVAGPAALAAGRVWIPDVHTDHDLDQIATRRAFPAIARCLWCGSAGLAHALARGDGGAPAPAADTATMRGPGATVLISASFQPVLYAQWAALNAALPTAALAEYARPDEIDRALLLARRGAAQVRFDLSPRREMTTAESIALLEANLRRIVEDLPPPGHLLVVGGDTLLALCRATGAQALLAGPALRTGWGRATLSGGRWHGVTCHSRSGAFGPPDDLLEMIRRLTHDNDKTPGKEDK